MLIELKNITVRHDEKVVLQGVNFCVDNNDFIYIVGKVGSGKSSLLRTLYADIPVKEGEAHILDFDLCKLKIKQVPLLRRQLGVVFQDFQLLHEKTIEQNLDFVLRATGWKKKQRPQRINEVLSLVGLNDKSQKFPHELSGGEQQRVCIARALLNTPKIILADEPIGNLDSDTSRQIMQLLQAIREQGTAVVMVTHNVHLISDFPGVVYLCANKQLTEITETYDTV